jgi:uncharacterized protein (TIGR03089 family)
VVSLSAPRRPGGLPADVPALLRALLDDDSGRPRLTWYGPDDERVEFSAKVLDNWVAKTANLLVDELDAGPGTVVAIDLPPHWRTVVWLLATWSTGAAVRVVPTGQPPSAGADVLVTAGPAAVAACPPGVRTVAVTLPALATSYDDDLPEDVLDYAREVRGYGDVFVPFVTPAPGDAAFEAPGHAPLTHRELVPAAGRAADEAQLPPRVRLLVGAGADDAVATLLAPLVRLGSVVLHHDLRALSATPDALRHLAAQEGTTATAPTGS